MSSELPDDPGKVSKSRDVDMSREVVSDVTREVAVSEVLSRLSPAQEHFLKKYLLENQLSRELHKLSQPDCCLYLGPPFAVNESKGKERLIHVRGSGRRSSKESIRSKGRDPRHSNERHLKDRHSNEFLKGIEGTDISREASRESTVISETSNGIANTSSTTPSSSTGNPLPLLSFFFQKFVATFPFVTNNPAADQRRFWQDTIQPFVQSFNLKNISTSEDRKENITKRRQVNKKFLSGLLLFYNSVVVTDKDMVYLREAHLKPSDTAKMDVLGSHKPYQRLEVGLDEYSRMVFHNDYSINIVAVRTIERAESHESSWNPLRTLGSGPKHPRHHYEFVIQVTKRVEINAKGRRVRNVFLKNDEEDINDSSHSVDSSSLKSNFSITSYHSTKSSPSSFEPNSNSINSNNSGSIKSNNSNTTPSAANANSYTYKSHFVTRAYHNFQLLEQLLKKALPGLMATDAPLLPRKVDNDKGVEERTGRTLVKEKLRLLLRGYMNMLAKFAEIVHSAEFRRFVLDGSFQRLTSDDIRDYNARLLHERHMVATQFEFQKHTAETMLQLLEDFNLFKHDVVMRPDTITQIFRELGTTADINKLLPLFRTFNEWSKLEVAATLYQVFLAQDNSHEWFHKCRKFHRLFPYSVVGGILRFTNPMKMVSRVIDLLLVSIPTFSMPSWRSWARDTDDKDVAELKKHSGSKNLMSMIFIMLLDEDLSDFSKELDSLRNDKIPREYAEFVARIDKYATLDNDVVADIHHEALVKQQDMLLTVLRTLHISPPIALELRLCAVEASYAAFADAEVTSDVEAPQLYLNLRQYWQVLVRKKDKDIFRELWQEPELTRLIKDFLTIFYQPLIRVFAKSDIYLVFKEFQYFMDDLMEELARLNSSDMYMLSSFEIFDRLKTILDRHEGALWTFIHNIYKNDDQQLFIKLIQWIESFLGMIRMKFVEPSRVTLDLASSEEKVDPNLFMRQLNARANKVLAKRRLFKEYLQAKALQNSTTQDQIDSKWDDINAGVFNGVEMKDFGVADEDVDEFNYLGTEDAIRNPEKAEGEIDAKLRRQLFRLDEECDAHGTSELDKLEGYMVQELSVMLEGLEK